MIIELYNSSWKMEGTQGEVGQRISRKRRKLVRQGWKMGVEQSQSG